MGHQSPYTMANSQIEGPIVSVYKHAYYESNPPLDPNSIVYAYGHVCQKQKWHACSQHSKKALASVTTHQKTMALRLQSESRNIHKRLKFYLHIFIIDTKIHSSRADMRISLPPPPFVNTPCPRKRRCFINGERTGSPVQSQKNRKQLKLSKNGKIEK